MTTLMNIHTQYPTMDDARLARTGNFRDVEDLTFRDPDTIQLEYSLP